MGTGLQMGQRPFLNGPVAVDWARGRSLNGQDAVDWARGRKFCLSVLLLGHESTFQIGTKLVGIT
jgi:hypothetical protein